MQPVHSSVSEDAALACALNSFHAIWQAAARLGPSGSAQMSLNLVLFVINNDRSYYRYQRVATPPPDHPALTVDRL